LASKSKVKSKNSKAFALQIQNSKGVLAMLVSRGGMAGQRPGKGASTV
jgi:hypothetical protein